MEKIKMRYLNLGKLNNKIVSFEKVPNKKSHENSSSPSKTEKSAAFFSPNSWHEGYKEKELNMEEVIRLGSENE